MLIDSLESRRHYSVTVSQTYPGFYEVQGDDESNTIAITVDSGSQFAGITTGGTNPIKTSGATTREKLWTTNRRSRASLR